MWFFVRKILFLLPPEWAHALGGWGLKILGWGPWPKFSPSRQLKQSFCGFRLASPLGLAAGFDKNAEYICGLRRLGFGFVEVGTVTLRPQPGNPLPRLFRVPEARALINRMGFNSEGADCVAERLTALRSQSRLDFPLGVNLGKNKETPLEEAGAEYAVLVERFYALADYLVINISSPNTPSLTDLQEGSLLGPLLAKVREARDRQAKQQGGELRPLLLKISPDLLPSARRLAVELAMAAGFGGIIASNTSRRRDFSGLSGLDPGLLSEAGGLSGQPLAAEQEALIPELRQLLGPEPLLISAGGIACPADAQRRLAAGANFVQLYTEFVYAGPGLPRKFLREFS